MALIAHTRRAALTLLLAAIACNPARSGTSAAAFATGTLRGHVSLDGVPPAPSALDRHSDPYCEKTPRSDESVMVGAHGGLRDTLVHLTGDLPAAPPTTSAPAIFEQHECVYQPRMLGLVAGQRLEVQSQDGTLHNVHIFRGTQTVLNRAQKVGSGPVGREVPGPEGLLEVKCDVHPWMTAFAYVSEHPWFAVTDRDGAFEIRDAPAGRRTVELWHERYGRLQADVTIPAGGVANLELSFSAAARAPDGGEAARATPGARTE